MRRRPDDRSIRRTARARCDVYDSGHVASVLIIEDDPVLAPIMRRHLEASGYQVSHAGDGLRGLQKVRYEKPDVVVLDLMLPGIDGWNVLEELRRDGNMTPVIVLSARSAEHDRINVIERGADDYLVKPASMKELVVRIGAILRRSRMRAAPGDVEVMTFPGLRLDSNQKQASLQRDDGTWTDAGLTVREFQLLWTLASSPGRVLGRDELMKRVWTSNYRSRDRTVDVCVRKVREKIDEQSPTHSYLHTHYGIGYRFEPSPAGETSSTA